MKNRRVFLASSQQDATWVASFADALREEGLEVFRPTGEIFGKLESWLRNAIETSDTIVAVLSKEADQNPALLFEVGAADASGKPIVPIVLGECPRTFPMIRSRKSLKATSPQETACRVAATIADREART